MALLPHFSQLFEDCGQGGCTARMWISPCTQRVLYMVMKMQCPEHGRPACVFNACDISMHAGAAVYTNAASLHSLCSSPVDTRMMQGAPCGRVGVAVAAQCA